MLQNAYFLAKIGADTAENEQDFAEILPNGRRVADRCQVRAAGGEARRVSNAAAEAKKEAARSRGPRPPDSWQMLQNSANF